VKIKENRLLKEMSMILQKERLEKVVKVAKVAKEDFQKFIQLNYRTQIKKNFHHSISKMEKVMVKIKNKDH
jgi:hypothetical protein